MELSQMSRDERSLLIFLETCAVDYCGRVNAARMNQLDAEITDRWKEEGFVDFGRIASKDHNGQGAHWVELSANAWELAHLERRARATRNKPMYTRTEDL